MGQVKLWCRVTIVGQNGEKMASVLLRGAGEPDIGTVDDLARLVLLAGRLGGETVVSDLSSELRALLDFAGIGVEAAGLRVEVEGQAELGKEALGIQESEKEGSRTDLGT
jgi:hypothetical protein